MGDPLVLGLPVGFDGRNARAWNNLANVLRSTGRSADAEKAYRKALEISPAYADPLNGLGVIAVQEGRAALKSLRTSTRDGNDLMEALERRPGVARPSSRRVEAVSRLRPTW